MKNLFILTCLSLLLLVSPCLSLSKEYDGIWFLGFDVQKSPFDNVKVREAVAHCLDKDYIATVLASEEIVPASPIPPGLSGYDETLNPIKHNPAFSKTLMRRAKYSIHDPKLKNISLLHTDGVKTIEIAKKIQKDLRQIGIKVNLVQVSYQDGEKWDAELFSRRHHLFLMGYKADVQNLFTQEATPVMTDSYRLVEPLFRTAAEANFTGYSNSTIDMLLDQTSVITPSLIKEREVKLKEINKLIYKEMPVLVLFYIEKI